MFTRRCYWPASRVTQQESVRTVYPGIERS